jgi:hypothetical protein
MSRMALLGGAALVLLASCDTLPSLSNWMREEPTAQVASHPLNTTPTTAPVRTSVNYAPAALEVATRVDRVGQQLLAANKHVGVGRPVFGTIGSPTPEIFHVGIGAVYVTEGLVKQCPTDRELTAVLASELGKIVAERVATAGKDITNPDVPGPVDLPIGGHGYAGDADPSHYVEMAKFAKTNPRQRAPARTDPDAVARYLLKEAGQQESDLQAVQPLLKAAQRNCDLERQFKGTPPPGAGGWTP